MLPFDSQKIDSHLVTRRIKNLKEVELSLQPSTTGIFFIYNGRSVIHPKAKFEFSIAVNEIDLVFGKLI